MPELLSPVGGPEQLLAAVRCGADAVYLGAKGFNARRNAQNFGAFGLPQAVSYCHEHGVKVHVTVNTLVTDPEWPQLLDTLQHIAESGVDAVAVLPFTRDFAASSPEEFLVQTFDGTVPSFLHVGYDFKFGARAAGTVRDLDSWAAVGGTSVQAHDLKSDDGAPITATRIRLLLAGGDVEEANRLLGRPYFMTGVAAYAHVDGVRYKAAVNVGVAATFADRATATCEVHLLDFSGDLYGKPVKVEFLHWLRPMRKFDDLDELIATVKGNIAWVRENL